MSEEEIVIPGAMSEHLDEEYKLNKPLWENYIRTIEGGEDYITAAFLTKKPAETDELFKNRLKDAFNFNHLATINTAVARAIFNQEQGFEIEAPALRIEAQGESDGENEVYDIDYVGNFDGNGTHIVDWFKEHAEIMQAYGQSYIEIKTYDEDKDFASRPAKDKSIHDLQQKGNIFYAELVVPEKVIHKSELVGNAYSYVNIKERYLETDDPFLKKEYDNQIRVLTCDYEAIYRNKGLYNGYFHKFGVPPVVPVTPLGTSSKGVGISICKDNWRIQKRIFNSYSDLFREFDYIYATLAISNKHLNRIKSATVDISKPIGFDSQDDLPRWLEAPVARATSLMQAISMLEAALWQKIGIYRSTSSQMFDGDSGKAKETEAENFKVHLKNWAANYAKAMEQSLQLISNYYEPGSVVKVKPPTSFNINSLTEEISRNLGLMTAGAFGSDAFMIELKSSIVKKMGYAKNKEKEILDQITPAPITQSAGLFGNGY